MGSPQATEMGLRPGGAPVLSARVHAPPLPKSRARDGHEGNASRAAAGSCGCRHRASCSASRSLFVRRKPGERQSFWLRNGSVSEGSLSSGTRPGWRRSSRHPPRNGRELRSFASSSRRMRRLFAQLERPCTGWRRLATMPTGSTRSRAAEPFTASSSHRMRSWSS